MVDACESVVAVVCAQYAAEIRFWCETVDGFHFIDCLDVRQHGRIVKGRLTAALRFIISIDKRLVFLQRAADSGAELVLAQNVRPGCLQEVDRVHLVVAEVFVKRAVPLIGAATRNDVHDARGGTSKFRGIIAVDYAKLLYSFLGRSATLNAGRGGNVIGAVDRNEVVMNILSGEGKFGHRLDDYVRISGGCVADRYRGREERENDEFPATHGELDNL